MPEQIWVVGGGLAGTEAAWQIANSGRRVVLYEMRPVRNTPAHTSDLLAELVCSNSLKANYLENASGLLKEEMRRLDSLIIKVADETRVPAGGALAV
ncbi:MAG TPA: methylenetetrahydrofolate--tRNA-(uracil(54)-C(5))-methyltransferase (FADH(2)-oxidizing) TrmFO, partial [Firmicutes bacterium]|nr:methylenetetrahydrofolate--tRNA-(uracil(54)-C(5))-methyltransferase (FADH(2)-oxidizing) TrmFO [Bacillota bacterium]